MTDKQLTNKHKKLISEWLLRYYDKVGRTWTINSAWYREWRVNKCRKYEHRRIMEEYLWRELSKDEIVHHKNWDKSDNRIENLEIMTREEHTRMHVKHNVNFLRWRLWVSPVNKTKKEDIDKIIELRKKWYLIREIRDILHISIPTITKYLQLNAN